MIPEAVTENSQGYLLVNNDPILWAMLNAIREQQREIVALRTQLRERSAKDAVLESRLAQLEHDRPEQTRVGFGRKVGQVQPALSTNLVPAPSKSEP